MKALDLFAGTGAISFELASRGCRRVVAVENYPVQYNFIRKVATQLDAREILPIKGDVFRFVPSCREKFDFIFADPPYDLPQFDEIAPLVLNAGLLAPGGIFVLEHSKKYDFSNLPEFDQQRIYGSVNFSFFTPDKNLKSDSEGQKSKKTLLNKSLPNDQPNNSSVGFFEDFSNQSK